VRTLPTGELTLLLTDIDGSTRLLHELGDRFAGVLAEHRRALRAAFDHHGGVEVDTQGDAFFVVFEAPDAAVAAAVAAQRALAGGPVRVRMGLHTGRPQRTAEGYVGMDLHRAARIAAAGHGGQVLLSRATADAVRSRFELRDLGEHRLKDLPGPEWIFQVEAPGLGIDFPPLRSLNNTNLPIPGRRLVGRAGELRDVCRAVRLGEGRVVTLTGPGGTGKTRLAVQAGLELVEDFPNGVLFVGLAPLTDPGLVIPAIAQTLGVREAPAEPLLETLAAHLRLRRLLLVLDNVEHVIEAAPDVARLVAQAPGLAVLATSREPLRVQPEQEIPVPPLAADPAVELFADRARAADPTFEPDAATAEICARLDGLPLAIELAAARVRLLPPPAMLERLERRLPLLRTSGRDVPARQRTLHATIDWSYGLLAEEEQALFRELAVFAGGCSLDAAERVCAAEPDVLESLVQKSLLMQRPDADGQPRVWMLATVREFADERLVEAGDHAVRARHAAWARDLAEAAEAPLLGRDQVKWLQRLEPELDNLRAAVGWSLAAGDAETALRTVSALIDFWDPRGAYGEALAWLERGLAAPAAAPDGVRAKALLVAGFAAFHGADVERAQRLTEQSLALAERLEVPRVRSRSLSQLAGIAVLRGEFAEAAALAERAAAVAEAAGDAVMRAFGLNMLAIARYECGEREAAERLFAETAALLRAAGDRRDASILEANLAEVALLAGDLRTARRRYDAAAALAEELGDRGRLPSYQQGLAIAALLDGSPEAAARHASAALAGGREVGDTTTLIGALASTAGVLAAFGDAVAAGVIRGAAEGVASELGVQLSGSDVLVGERVLEAAAGVLGERAWADAVSEGRMLPLGPAVERALADLAGALAGGRKRDPARWGSVASPPGG
jgi:predicted ATPase/class 3 adenylate cyclase